MQEANSYCLKSQVKIQSKTNFQQDKANSQLQKVKLTATSQGFPNNIKAPKPKETTSLYKIMQRVRWPPTSFKVIGKFNQKK